MSILVTGCHGTIGKCLLKSLRSENEDVWGLDLCHCEDPFYIRADIREYRQLLRVFESVKPQYVYHLAAEFGRVNGEEYYEQLWTTNVVGTRHIIELCAKMNTKLIFASSSEAYGEMDVAVMDESLPDKMPQQFHNDYSITKRVNEHQILRFVKHHGLEAMILRFFNAYGPGEYYSPYRSVCCLFCYRILKELPITVYRNYHRAFMYIDDFINTLKKCHNSFINNEIINIGGTDYRTVEELVEIIEQCTGKKAIANYIPKELANITNKCPNIQKARKLLGHNPITPLEVGIVKTVEWMRGVY